MALDLSRSLRALRRLAVHRWQESGVRRALPDDALARLSARVAASEQLHTGQIRICAEGALPWSYLHRDATARERALMLFSKLRVWDTEHNNGVLIYLLVPEHAIEIVADRGLARSSAPREWEAVVSQLAVHLRSGHFEQGLTQAVDTVTAQLVKHFGRDETDALIVNELPDAPVIGWTNG